MKPLLDKAEPNALPSLDTICVISARRRKKRAYHRIISGLHAKGNYKFLTLTSSPESPDDIQRSWRKLVMRLQRRGLLNDGYIRITEYTHQGRPHFHIIYRGYYIQQKWISFLWQDIHKAPVVYVSAVRSRQGISNYLAKYMAKGAKGRLSWSYKWLYRGFGEAWRILKKIGREYDINYYRVLKYWKLCCKLRVKPLEVKIWQHNERVLKQRVNSVGKRSDVITEATLSQPFINIIVSNTLQPYLVK